MKTCFSEGNLMKQFGSLPFLREPPLSSNPLFLSNFFMTPLFVQILKRRSPSLTKFMEGEETMGTLSCHGQKRS